MEEIHFDYGSDIFSSIQRSKIFWNGNNCKYYTHFFVTIRALKLVGCAKSGHVERAFLWPQIRQHFFFKYIILKFLLHNFPLFSQLKVLWKIFHLIQICMYTQSYESRFNEIPRFCEQIPAPSNYFTIVNSIWFSELLDLVSKSGLMGLFVKSRLVCICYCNFWPFLVHSEWQRLKTFCWFALLLEAEQKNKKNMRNSNVKLFEEIFLLMLLKWKKFQGLWKMPCP